MLLFSVDDAALEARKDQLTGTGRTAIPFVVVAHGKEKDPPVQWPEKSKSLAVRIPSQLCLSVLLTLI